MTAQLILIIDLLSVPSPRRFLVRLDMNAGTFAVNNFRFWE